MLMKQIFDLAVVCVQSQWCNAYIYIYTVIFMLLQSPNRQTNLKVPANISMLTVIIMFIIVSAVF